MAGKPKSLWQQVCDIKNPTRKAEAQQLYDGVQGAEALARGPDKRRSDFWKQKSAERRQEFLDKLHKL